MDETGYALVQRPMLWQKLGWRRRVPLAQSRPPVGFQPHFETLAVQGSDDVTADAYFILDDECQRWLKAAVRSGEDVAQDPRVLNHRRRVLAAIACLQADPVQVV